MIKRGVVTGGCALVLALATAPSVSAADGEVSLQILPKEVRVAAGSDAQVVVVVDNPTKRGLKGLSISGVVPSTVTLEPAIQGPLDVPAGASKAVTFTVSRSDSGTLPATVLLKADYEQSTPDGLVPRVAIGEFQVSGQAAESTADVGKVTIHAPAAAVDEFRDQQVLVAVTNTSTSPIRLSGVTPEAPDESALEIVPVTPSEGRVIPPGDQIFEEFEIALAADAAVRSGEEVVAWTVTLEWGRDFNRTSEQLVTQTVKLGVFSESELGEFLKLPSLLFLPGFVLLMTLVLLSKVEPYRAPGFADVLTKDVATGAFLTVLGSLAIGASYFQLYGRDIRAGYSFNDVIALCWLGLCAAAIGKLGWALYAWGRDRARAERTPAPGDDALQALTKLGRRGASLEQPEAFVKARSERVWVYDSPVEDRRVVGPKIGYKFVKPDEHLDERINACRNEKRADLLAKALKDGVAAEKLKVFWSPQEPGEVTDLRKIPVDKLDLPEKRSSIVDVV